MITHRSTGLLAVVVFFAIALLIFSATPQSQSSSTTAKSETEDQTSIIPDYVPRPKLPKLDSFRFSIYPPATHKPPEQKNSTSGASKWYSDWKWLNPFSSTITLDENRSVLPPLRQRPPIYTFYDSYARKEKDLAQADAKLLLTWRRAWFAQGFRPIVLGPSEAMNNPLYEEFRAYNVGKELETGFLEWLAWGSMGTSTFANWQCFPMAHYDDNMLSYLRRGTAPEEITRVDGLGSAIFSGEGSKINEAVRIAFKAPKAKESKNILDLIPADLFRTEKSKSIVVYDSATLKSRYPEVGKKIEESLPEGRLGLADLINSHLQTTFQNTFTSGIHVLKPYAENTTALISPGSRLATLLSECVPSPIPKSCPPNHRMCWPCRSSSSIKVSHTEGYKNSSSVFTIGTLPHPYTHVMLQKGDDNITATHIRRETERDGWLVEITKPLLGPSLDGSSRVVALKEIVAGNHGMSRGLWFTVENLPVKPEMESLPSTIIDELDWYFGFVIPRNTQKELDNKDSAPKIQTGDEKQKLDHEYQLIEKARKALKSKKKDDVAIISLTEAWNLADSELWRFVRAYRARSVVERKKWEEEERGFAGST